MEKPVGRKADNDGLLRAPIDWLTRASVDAFARFAGTLRANAVV